MHDPGKLLEMKKQSRKAALRRSWDAVFEKVYRAYDECRRIQMEEAQATSKKSVK